MPQLRVSALDLSPIVSGSSAGDALRNTLDLAQHVERLGFTRYWLAEHHNAASLASSSPEILIGLVAQTTRGMRVGSGGIMLPNHSALKVAEGFRVLQALFPVVLLLLGAVVITIALAYYAPLVVLIERLAR